MFLRNLKALNRKWKWTIGVLLFLYFLPLLSHMLMWFMPNDNLTQYFKEKGVVASEHVIQTSGGQLHYYKLGPDTGQWVVWVHGSPGSAADVREQAALSAARGFQVILLDRPGYGKSHLFAAESLTTQAQAIFTILDTVATGQTCMLASHSYGGAVVLKAATLQPQRVRKLLLVSPTLDPSLERNNRMKRLAQSYGLSWPIRWMLPKELLQSAREMRMLPGEIEASLPAIRKLRCTVSEIHGTEDALAPFGNQAFIRKNLPLSQRYFLTYKHADHFIIWKHPNAVQQLL